MNDRIVQGTAVDSGVGADFNIIVQHHSPQLRNLVPNIAVTLKTKTVRANNRTRMNDATFASSDIVTPRIAEGADPVRDESGKLLHWHRNVFSYPPVGAPDGGAHVTVNDVVAFHRALIDGRLLSPDLTAQMLRPHEVYRARGTGTHRTGFGFEFLTDQNGDVECYWKEGINVGVSATLTYYPPSGVTLVILSSMEDGAWEPLKHVDRMLGVTQVDPDTIT